MFLHIQVLTRRGANIPPTLSEQLLRIDRIQRMCPIEVSDWDKPCTELILDNEESITCEGTFEDLLRALNEVC